MVKDVGARTRIVAKDVRNPVTSAPASNCGERRRRPTRPRRSFHKTPTWPARSNTPATGPGRTFHDTGGAAGAGETNRLTQLVSPLAPRGPRGPGLAPRPKTPACPRPPVTSAPVSESRQKTPAPHATPALPRHPGSLAERGTLPPPSFTTVSSGALRAHYQLVSRKGDKGDDSEKLF